MEDTFTTDDLTFVLLAKLPNGKIHQVFISQDKLKENLLYLIEGDSLQLIDNELTNVTIDKNETT